MAIETFVLNRATSSGDIGQSFRRNFSGSALVSVSVAGTGAVSATADVYVSQNGFAWQLLRSVTASGTNSAAASFDNSDAWPYFKCDITALSGTDAVADVLLSSTDCESSAGIAGAFKIEGSNTVGGVLTVAPDSDWVASSYQWTRDGADIAGQTA
ncbi:hypothetical protein, partial [Plesiomonas sp.]|uniref:hypothetical protein n=1 Tax=Plesiomonas sp. TaxID=2486279 RepID=UPI003F344096